MTTLCLTVASERQSKRSVKPGLISSCYVRIIEMVGVITNFARVVKIFGDFRILTTVFGVIENCLVIFNAILVKSWSIIVVLIRFIDIYMRAMRVGNFI